MDFVGAVNGPNWLDAQKWVFGARSGFFGASEWGRGWKIRLLTIQVDNISVDKIEGETASASVIYSFTYPDPDKKLGEVSTKFLSYERTEVLQLRLAPAGVDAERLWQIVAPATAPRDLQNTYHRNTLATLSYVLEQKRPIASSLAQSSRSLAQLRRLAVAARRFATDSGGRIAWLGRYAPEALQPYLGDNNAFFVPLTKELYAVNLYLSDKKLVDIVKPAETVLFYEGRDQKPLFRYGGKAAIAFVDGSAKFVSLEEAKTLIWKP